MRVYFKPSPEVGRAVVGTDVGGAEANSQQSQKFTQHRILERENV